jgi:hypothetical protein
LQDRQALAMSGGLLSLASLRFAILASFETSR